MPGTSVAPPGLRDRFAPCLPLQGFHPWLLTVAPAGLRQGTTPESLLSQSGYRGQKEPQSNPCPTERFAAIGPRPGRRIRGLEPFIGSKSTDVHSFFGIGRSRCVGGSPPLFAA